MSGAMEDKAAPGEQKQLDTTQQLEEAYGPSIWESASGTDVPSDAWEYHIRKSLNDAAYTNLEYVPYCSTMPVQKGPAPKFMWKRKERH